MQVLISRPTMLSERMLPAGLVLELAEAEARRLIALGHAVPATASAAPQDAPPSAPAAAAHPEAPRRRRA